MVTVRTDRHTIFPGLLVASILGVYVLVMLGATAAVTEAIAACDTWPTCDGRWLVPFDDPAAIAWAHRAVALVVGVLITVTTVVGWRAGSDRRSLLAMGAALSLYPLQVGIGALTAMYGPSRFRSAAHLLIAMTIFASLVLALAWTLEHRFPSERQSASPEPRSRPDETGAHPATRTGWRGILWAYLRLTKPRLMWLLCLVAVAGMALAAGPTLEVSTLIATLAGGVLAIGASGTFNNVLERDVDRRMSRTADRPLVTERVPLVNAVAFGIILAVASIAIFVSMVNWVAAALGLAAIVFYSVVYTLILKPHTVQNTVIGGAAGALPALIGWAAVRGTVGIPAVLLAAVIFCWTPAHFYNLAMAYREDYERGGFPMLPVVRGGRVARKHVLLYAGLTMVMTATLSAASSLDWVFALGAILAGSVFLVAIVHLHRERTRRAAIRTFHASNAYLGLILLVLTVDALML